LHAIEGSASAPTAEHHRRRPRTAGDRAGKQNRQIIGALVERFRHFSDPVSAPRRLAWPKDKPQASAMPLFA
jgi:hypothetical protein